MAQQLRGGRLGIRALAAACGLIPAGVLAVDVTASPPQGLSVTIYRLPDRGQGEDLNPDDPQGFALIAETRTVFLPAGESRLRFPGVADGIEAVSAILTGLPAGVLEKNRDAQVLTPAALVAATLGQEVILERTNRKTGRVTRTTGRLRSDEDGVVFESSEGVEALRCSGLPETFTFSGTAGLFPTPTLSVQARTDHPLTAKVTLSYLAYRFDWAANYTATLSADGQTLDLGAWVTLANGNAVSFPDSSVAVVAGRLHRENGGIEAFKDAGSIMALCWGRNSTSDIPYTPPPPRGDDRPEPAAESMRMFKRRIAGDDIEDLVQEEQLGDLKLYRVPHTTSLNAQQMKQVRLLDREDVPVELLHVAELAANEETETAARRVLRMRNDSAHHLGLPLPAGRVDTFVDHDDTPLLLQQAPLRDIAVGEELEIGAGAAPDVQVRTVQESTTINPGSIRSLPLLPGVVHLRRAARDDVQRIEITNASRSDIHFEARLRLPDGTQLIGATPAPVLANGRQVLSARIPAGGRTVMRYRTEHIKEQAVRPR